MALELITVIVSDDSVPSQLVEGVTVRLYPEGEYTHVQEQETDDEGEATMLIDVEEPSQRFEVRFYKRQTRFPTNTFIEVESPAEDTQVFDVTATVQDRPVSTDPNLCRCYGYASSLNTAGLPLETSVIWLSPYDETFVGHGLFVAGKAQVKVVGTDGLFWIDLVREQTYIAEVLGMCNVLEFTVPDRSWADFSDLLFIYVATLTLTPDDDSVSLEQGTETELDLSVILSNTQELTDYDARNWLTIESSDVSVASIRWELSSRKLTIRGVATGSTTITIDADPDYSLPRVPPKVVDPVTITVTVVSDGS